MTGGIDDISFKLGQQSAALTALQRTFEQRCEDDDRRHEENKAELEGIQREQQLSREQLQRLVDAVATMQPIIRNSKRRLAALALIGTGVVIVLGWIAEAVVKWALAHLLSMKFGG